MSRTNMCRRPSCMLDPIAGSFARKRSSIDEPPVFWMCTKMHPRRSEITMARPSCRSGRRMRCARRLLDATDARQELLLEERVARIERLRVRIADFVPLDPAREHRAQAVGSLLDPLTARQHVHVAVVRTRLVPRDRGF